MMFLQSVNSDAQWFTYMFVCLQDLNVSHQFRHQNSNQQYLNKDFVNILLILKYS